jgi:DNA segregation ATPase FtsK/SpoIIIE, S-DNA-T family
MSKSYDRPLRVFLCHASQDKPIVRELYQRLALESWIDAWLDEERILLGQDWDLKIQKELDAADAVIVFISDVAMKKEGYVQKELRLIYDIALNKPEDVIFVIPLRLEDCQPPWRFRLWQWGDYFGGKKDLTYYSLIQSLKKRYQQTLQLERKNNLPRNAKDVALRVERRKISEAKGEYARTKILFSQKLVHKRKRNERILLSNIFLADQTVRPDERLINRMAEMIEKTLSEFGIVATVIGFRLGPTVTQFAIQPVPIKRSSYTAKEYTQQMKKLVTQLASLQKDLELALSVERLRVAAVPDKPYISIEVPNSRKSTVRMRSILETDAFNKNNAPLAIAVGRDVGNGPVVADLERMPHLFITGLPESGKSVCIASVVACLAMNNSPEDLRMVMIDSKMVGLWRFNGLPHLYGKVEVNIDRILGVLRWLIIEMENRYRLIETDHGVATLPRIVVFIDELAYLLMLAPEQTEYALVRLTKSADAVGIHLIIATRPPFMNAVMKIKANVPARLAFALSSAVDSRSIINATDAENLLGQGDMLFLIPDVSNPVRAQGVMVTDQEIESLVVHWQKVINVSQEAPPWEELLTEPEKEQDEPLIEKAITVVRQSQRASASMLQRRLRIGYPRAARLLDQLEEMGIIGPSLGGGKERVILPESTVNDSPIE